jgi:replicative DNA helicase
MQADDLDLYVPPHSPEAEKAVLGAVLHDKDGSVLAKIQAIIGEADFYVDRHRQIFQAITSLQGRKYPIDLTTLQNEIRRRGVLADIGGSVFLSQLLDATPTVQNAKHYANIVREWSDLRAIREVSVYLQESVIEGQAGADEIIVEASKRLTALAHGCNSSDRGLRPISEAVSGLVDFLETEYEGLPTGFPTVDKKIAGLRGLVLIGGPPKKGKSIFCLNVALHVAQKVKNSSVLYYDLETGEQLLTLRLLSNFYNKTFEQLRQERDKGSEWQRNLKEALPNFLFCTDPKDMMPDSIESRVALQGSKRVLLVLDSLQKLPALEKQRRDSIDAWLRVLERLKLNSNVTILLVSELSRGDGEINYKRPSLGSFKESGDIEYTADVALQLIEIIEDGKKLKDRVALHCVAHRYRGEPGLIVNLSYRDFLYWRWVEVPR